MTAQEKLITVALAEEGYLEKKSNKDLDSKTANAGKANYTKYGRDLVKWIGSPYANGVAWCDMFVDWCFITAFGKEKAKQMINGWSAYCPTSADYYKKVKRWYTTPKVGDQIFFQSSSRIGHTGIVVKVEGGKVYTIEGNTSSSSGVVANGGCVRCKSYALNYKSIAGYGRPKYELVQEVTPVENAKAKVIANGVDVTEYMDPNKFDVKKYRATFADLNAAFGDDWGMYYWHYAMAGKAEIDSGKRPKFM